MTEKVGGGGRGEGGNVKYQIGLTSFLNDHLSGFNGLKLAITDFVEGHNILNVF
jgi:hypothetical protein